MIREYISKIILEAIQKHALKEYERYPRYYTVDELREYEEAYKKYQEGGSGGCEKCHDALICYNIVNGQYHKQFLPDQNPPGVVVSLPEEFP